MSWYRNIAAAVIVTACAFAPCAWAETRVLVEAPYIDLRTGPGRGYPVFHVAERREELVLHKQRTDWYRVTAEDGVTGWVHREDLQGTVTPEGDRYDFSTPGWREYRERRWEMGLQVGDFARTSGMTLHLGFRLLPQLSAEAKYLHAFGHSSDSEVITGNLVYRPWPDWRWAPFVSVGGGVIDTERHTALVDPQPAEGEVYTAGIGGTYTISARFGLRAELNRYVLSTDVRDSNEEVNEWKIGFSVSF